MEWLRNLFKSHVQKRMEQRQLEVEMKRQSRRMAGPPPQRPTEVRKSEDRPEELNRVA